MYIINFNALHVAIIHINYFTGVHCTSQFQHDTEQCLDQLVEYQCTVTGTGFTSLTWKISEDNGTQLGNTVTYTSNSIGASVTIGGVFTVEQLQPSSPIVSNISFTVQSSINGYTIVCEDSATMNNENLTINVPGMMLMILEYYVLFHNKCQSIVKINTTLRILF